MSGERGDLVSHTNGVISRHGIMEAAEVMNSEPGSSPGSWCVAFFVVLQRWTSKLSELHRTPIYALEQHCTSPGPSTTGKPFLDAWLPYDLGLREPLGKKPNNRWKQQGRFVVIRFN